MSSDSLRSSRLQGAFLVALCRRIGHQSARTIVPLQGLDRTCHARGSKRGKAQYSQPEVQQLGVNIAGREELAERIAKVGQMAAPVERFQQAHAPPDFEAFGPCQLSCLMIIH